MEFLNVKKDFEWVIRVLESCNSLTQVHTSDNLFEFFLKKWEIDLFEERKTELTSMISSYSEKALELSEKMCCTK